MPECPLSLLGQGLLCKLNAYIAISEDSIQLHIPPENAWEAQVCLLAKQSNTGEDLPPSSIARCNSSSMGCSNTRTTKNVEPVKISLKPGDQPVSQPEHCRFAPSGPKPVFSARVRP